MWTWTSKSFEFGGEINPDVFPCNCIKIVWKDTLMQTQLKSEPLSSAWTAFPWRAVSKSSHLIDSMLEFYFGYYSKIFAVYISFLCAESYILILISWDWYLYVIESYIVLVLWYKWYLYWYYGIEIVMALVFTSWEWFEKTPVILPAARQLSCFPNISSNYNFNGSPKHKIWSKYLIELQF